MLTNNVSRRAISLNVLAVGWLLLYFSRLVVSCRGRGRCNLNLEILISSTAAAQYIQLMHIYYLNFAATRQLFLNMPGNQGEDGQFLF